MELFGIVIVPMLDVRVLQLKVLQAIDFPLAKIFPVGFKVRSVGAVTDPAETEPQVIFFPTA